MNEQIYKVALENLLFMMKNLPDNEYQKGVITGVQQSLNLFYEYFDVLEDKDN